MKNWAAKIVSSLEMSRSWLAGPTYSDLTYAVADGQELCLDLYLPFWNENCPLLVYFHGGGWSSGSYKEGGVSWLTGYGFAVASVQYRLSGEARFPAQIHDAKGAIRWLRAHGKEYGYSTEKVGAVGISSGGHLAMMVGLAGNQLEGGVGGYLEESSGVDAVVNYFGASDFILRSQTQPGATEPVGSVVRKLLGSSVSENEDLARKASPVFHAKKNSPPLFVMHGAKDAQVKVDQAYRIVERYQELGCEVELEILEEGGHGGMEFFNENRRLRVARFLRKHLGLEDLV
jgi:acetyl esterase/lipase